jgi:hypothetical protein
VTICDHTRKVENPFAFRQCHRVDPAFIAKLKGAFERDPLTTYFAILVAGNRVHPTQLITIANKAVMVPKWGGEGWGWWGQLAHVIQDAAYAGKTPPAAVKLSGALDDLLIKRPELVAGDGFDPNAPPIYIDINPQSGDAGKAWTGNVITKAGAVVKDAAAWMWKNKAVVAAVTASVLAFIAAGPPAVIAAILVWLAANPTELGKVFEAAGKLVREIVGGVVRGLFGMGPLALLALGVGAWYVFFRGGERHAD